MLKAGKFRWGVEASVSALSWAWVSSTASEPRLSSSCSTVRAPLPRPIAVFLLYWTAYVGPDGQVNFRDDPYGWDETLMQRIDAGSHGAA